MKKILVIVGNRPNLIKASKLIKALKKERRIKLVCAYTGQHFNKEMKNIFFRGLDIPIPDYDLKKTELGEMIDAVNKVINKEKPHYVIVWGDTRSTFAGAISALDKNIPLIHVEAGCRSYNDSEIEERYRRIIDRVSLIRLCPSRLCIQNLIVEGMEQNNFWVGATQLDALLSTLPTKPPKDAYQYSVLTLHRGTTLSDKEKLKSIFEALGKSQEKIYFPCHPHTRKVLNQHQIKVPSNIKTERPWSYKKTIHTIAYAKQVITDSGGLQVEAYFLRVPVIILREETEWIEIIGEKWGILVGQNKDKILKAIKDFHPTKGQHQSQSYGLGSANKFIVQILKELK